MRYRSIKSARVLGLIMIFMVSAWDMDAMRSHIAAHSWYTLALVVLFLIAHVLDYLTVGRLISRIDPLLRANSHAMAHALHNEMRRSEMQNEERIHLARATPSRNPDRPRAKLYTFTAVNTTAARVSGALYPIPQQRFIVEPE